MTTPSLVNAGQPAVASLAGTRSADFSDEDVRALAGWLAELPHLDRVLGELRRLREHAVPETVERRTIPACDCSACADLQEAQAQVVHLKSALVRNRDIAAAVGILMSRHRITQADAFDLLRRSSQTSHRKLYDVALEVLEAGELYPGTKP